MNLTCVSPRCKVIVLEQVLKFVMSVTEYLTVLVTWWPMDLGSMVSTANQEIRSKHRTELV